MTSPDFARARDEAAEKHSFEADGISSFPSSEYNERLAEAFKSGADWALQYTLDHGPVALAFVYRQAQERQVSRIAELEAALSDVWTWITNWDPNFASDPEWPETEAKVRKALEKEASK